jgi:hypothetical protein
MQRFLKFGLLELGLIGAGLLLIAGLVMGGEEHEEEHESFRAMTSAPVFEPYQTECGSCHMAYPPSLLPARSWEALMAGLADHFGDNAELPADSVAKIRDYLVTNAADHSNARRAFAFARAVPAGEAPLRITETPYFKRKHDEVPLDVVRKIPEIGSFSNCQACHRQANAGSFNEHTVNIPGYGRWDD